MRKRRLVFVNKEIDENLIKNLNAFDGTGTIKKRKRIEKSLTNSLMEIAKRGEELYEKGGRTKELYNLGLLSIKHAYEYLVGHGYNITRRALSGRIERGVLPAVKIGKRRYVFIDMLNEMIEREKELYSVKKAYNIIAKYKPNFTFRAFLGRIEKGSIPSVKLNHKRYIPKNVIESLVKLAKDYYSVDETYKELRSKGVKIRRNTLERRLDRNVIPHMKIAGKRYIHKDVVNELIDLELKNQNR